MSLQQFCMKLVHAYFYCQVLFQEINHWAILKAYFAQMLLWDFGLKWKKKKKLNHLQEVKSCKRLVSFPRILLQSMPLYLRCEKIYITIWYQVCYFILSPFMFRGGGVFVVFWGFFVCLGFFACLITWTDVQERCGFW